MNSKLFLILCCVFLSACSLYESPAKKLLLQEAFTRYDSLNPKLFTHCQESQKTPAFLENDNLDEFVIDSKAAGFLDSKNLKFFSYTKHQNTHYYCQSSMDQLNLAQTPYVLLDKFNQLLEELLK